MSEEKPQHLKLITNSAKWDWREENPVEIILLVFILTIFFLMPRAGCGITQSKVHAKKAVAKPAPIQVINARPNALKNLKKFDPSKIKRTPPNAKRLQRIRKPTKAKGHDHKHHGHDHHGHKH